MKDMKPQGGGKKNGARKKEQDEDKNEGIERLKELYAEWQEKRNPHKYLDIEKYLIDEPDELDPERFW